MSPFRQVSEVRLWLAGISKGDDRVRSDCWNGDYAIILSARDRFNTACETYSNLVAWLGGVKHFKVIVYGVTEFGTESDGTDAKRSGRGLRCNPVWNRKHICLGRWSEQAR